MTNIIIYRANTEMAHMTFESILPWMVDLRLTPICQSVPEKMSQKWLKTTTNGSFLVDHDGQLWLLADGMKVAPHWQAQQQRVIKAGKKTELLLKACKLQPNMQVIDGTAGFGHDGLLIATQAPIIMLEQNPLMFILLQQEKHTLQQHPHWQKLLQNLQIIYGAAEDKLTHLTTADVIYLDPMFPHDSYAKAQVHKTMQVLQAITKPPNLKEQQKLFNISCQNLADQGRLVIKRPKKAPYFANQEPNTSIENHLIRFDCYLKA